MGICLGILSQKNSIEELKTESIKNTPHDILKEDGFERQERPPSIRIPKYKVNFTESMREVKQGKNQKNQKSKKNKKLYTR